MLFTAHTMLPITARQLGDKHSIEYKMDYLTSPRTVTPVVLNVGLL